MSDGGAATLAAITQQDVEGVADFLHTHLNDRVSQQSWSRALVPPWPIAAPNHGFLLRDAGQIVGVHVAFYSERLIEGRVERFCNLGAWCVRDDYRPHGLRLLRALLRQSGYHFTDLSPSGNVVALNRRLHFTALDTTTTLVPNLPWPVWSRARLTTDPASIAATLRGEDLKIYLDHRGAQALCHLVITTDSDHCYIVVRKERRKGLPLFASVLRVGNSELLRHHWQVLPRHLLLRHGALVTLAEHRVLGFRPRWGRALKSPRPRMFKSDRLGPAAIDYMYSELACVAW